MKQNKQEQIKEEMIKIYSQFEERKVQNESLSELTYYNSFNFESAGLGENDIYVAKIEKGEENIVGAPSLFMYKISSVTPGKTTIKFEYKRSWETKAAEESLFYEVIVKPNGKLVLKEAKGKSKNGR